MENAQQVQNPVPQPPTIQPVEQKAYGKKKWGKWILIYTVLILIIFSGIYYFYIRTLLNFHSDPLLSVIDETSLTPTPDSTANWETFTNKKY